MRPMLPTALFRLRYAIHDMWRPKNYVAALIWPSDISDTFQLLDGQRVDEVIDDSDHMEWSIIIAAEYTFDILTYFYEEETLNMDRLRAHMWHRSYMPEGSGYTLPTTMDMQPLRVYRGGGLCRSPSKA